jgi:hypothetical protein
MRTWAVLFGVIIVGAVLFLALAVFPIWNLFAENVTANATVTSSSNGACIVDTPDQRAKVVKNCDLPKGTEVTVNYRPDSAEATIVSQP